MEEKKVPTQSERQAQIRAEVSEANARFLSFLRGAAKAVTTDIPGFVADIADKLAGDTTKFGEKDRSEQMFSKTGWKKSDKPGTESTELLGSIANPGNLLKAIFLPALAMRTLGEVKAAKKAADAGVSGEEIFAKTGVFHLPAGAKDNTPRAVLSDVGAQIRPDYVRELRDTSAGKSYFQLQPRELYQLDEVLDHPELFKKLPDFRDIVVTHSARAGYRSAFYNRVENAIGLGSFPSTQELNEALLHEIQHGVQQYYGMSGGAAIPMFYKDYDSAKKAAHNLSQKVEQLRLDAQDPTLPAMAQRSISRELERAQVDLGVLAKAKLKAHEGYSKVAGEAEARAVEYMYGAKDPGRTFPLNYYAKDVPLSQLISHPAAVNMVDEDEIVKLIIQDALKGK